MLRITITLGGLVCAVISAGFARVASETMTDAQKRQAHRPYIAAATDCIARAITETPVALRHARDAMWMEAVRMTGRHCDPVVTLRRGPRVRLAWSCVAGPTVVQGLRRRG